MFICQVPRKLFEHEAVGRVFKHLQRGLANVKAMKQTWVMMLFLHFGMIPLNNVIENAWKAKEFVLLVCRKQ